MDDREQTRGCAPDGGVAIMTGAAMRVSPVALQRPRLLVADDHPLILSGIEALLSDSVFEMVGTAGDGEETLALVASLKPDIVLLDVEMPGRGGMGVLRTLRAQHDNRPVILLAANLSDADLIEAIELGVQGILPKAAAVNLLLVCLAEVAAGGRWIERSMLHRALALAKHKGEDARAQLTRRERAVAQLVAQGLRNKNIAAELGVTEGTIKLTVHHIFAKLRISNRVELAMAMRGGGVLFVPAVCE